MITKAQLQAAKHDLLGTCERLSFYIERKELDVSEAELEDALLDVNIEPCQDCDWWHESGELDEDDRGRFVCIACYDPENED